MTLGVRPWHRRALRDAPQRRPSEWRGSRVPRHGNALRRSGLVAARAGPSAPPGSLPGGHGTPQQTPLRSLLSRLLSCNQLGTRYADNVRRIEVREQAQSHPRPPRLRRLVIKRSQAPSTCAQRFAGSSVRLLLRGWYSKCEQVTESELRILSLVREDMATVLGAQAMDRGRKRLLLTPVVAAIALATVSAVLYHWWYWYRFTGFANLVERSRITLPKYLGDAVLSPDGGKMFMLHEPDTGQGYVRVFDTTSDGEVESIELGPGFPVSLAVTPDGQRLLVAVSRYRGGSNGGTLGENRLELIDVATGKVTGQIPIPGRCASFVAVTEDGKSAYVSERTSVIVDHVDLTANRVVERIKVPVGPFTIVMKKGTHLLYVVSLRGGDRAVVSVIDKRSDTIVATVNTDLKRDTQPSEAFFSRDDDRLYVMNPRDSRIAVIDTDPESPTYHQQVELIAAPGDAAWRMCFNPDTTLAWVLVEPWGLALLDTNPSSPRYHSFVDRRPIDNRCRFLLHAPPNRQMKLYLFDDSDGLIRVLAPNNR